MPDVTPLPVVAGQAAINSHTVLGATLGTMAGLGDDPVVTPAIATLLVVAAKMPPDQAAAIARVVVVLGSYAWTLWGRYKAAIPITGLLKP